MTKNRYFKGFNHLFGRAKRSAAGTLKERFDEILARAPGQLHSLFAKAVEPEKIVGPKGCRERLFPADVTFWGMLGQVFRGGSLRDAVREIQASVCAAGSGRELGGGTGSYSDARQRLAQSSVDAAHRRVCEKMIASGGLLGERRVMVVDGTSVQLEDTPANQEEYPQPVGQKTGCGFPVMQIVALFNLGSAALERFSCSAQTAGEGSMFDVELMEHLQAGDVLLGDRLYGSYLHFAGLAAQGVDVVTRLHGSRAWPKGARGNDVLVQWKRPAPSARPQHVTRKEWEALPATLTVRYVRYRIDNAGFRTRHIMVATTLWQPPVQELAQLYLRRWDIELCFDDIKTTLGMDFIRAKSPAMAVKMLTMYAIAYNLVRLLIHRPCEPPAFLAPMCIRCACPSRARWTPPCASPPKWLRPAAKDGTACEKNSSAPSPPIACPSAANASNPESSNDDQNLSPE
jgi:hypothetical protein